MNNNYYDNYSKIMGNLLWIASLIPNDKENDSNIFEKGKVTIDRKDNEIILKINLDGDCDITEEDVTYDDTFIKAKVDRYKHNIEEIKDCDFLDILEEMKEVIDIKEFDELLEMDSFTEETAARVEELIDHSTLIVRKFLQNKIQNLMELYENF